MHLTLVWFEETSLIGYEFKVFMQNSWYNSTVHAQKQLGITVSSARFLEYIQTQDNEK